MIEKVKILMKANAGSKFSSREYFVLSQIVLRLVPWFRLSALHKWQWSSFCQDISWLRKCRINPRTEEIKPDKLGNLYQKQWFGAILGPCFVLPWFFFWSHRPTGLLHEKKHNYRIIDLIVFMSNRPTLICTQPDIHQKYWQQCTHLNHTSPANVYISL